MTTDFEARLSELLHRVTPEPPRGVTVEDVAVRLANQVSSGGAPSYARRSRGSRPRRGNVRGPGRGDGQRRRWAPLLAAASVVVVAGASTGIAVALSGNSKPAAPLGAASVTSQASSPGSGQTTMTVPATTVASQPGVVASSPAGNMWGAVPNTAQTLNAATLVGGDGAFFGLTDTALVKLGSSGAVTARAAYPSGFPNQPPVIAGHAVWLVFNYGGSVEVHGFSTSTLAPAGQFTVSIDGGLPSGAPDGILAGTPAGHLWVAAGSSVKLVNPASGAVLRTIAVGGVASSVAAAPDGSVVYVGTSAGASLKVTEYDAATGASRGSWTPGGVPGSNLVASSGGVFLVTGSGSSGQLWFAPAGNVPGARVVVTDSHASLAFQPSYSGGVVWIGGSTALRCIGPAGSVRAMTAVPQQDGSSVEYGDVAVAGGHAVVMYLSSGLQAGAATPVYPPAACF